MICLIKHLGVEMHTTNGHGLNNTRCGIRFKRYSLQSIDTHHSTYASIVVAVRLIAILNCNILWLFLWYDGTTMMQFCELMPLNLNVGWRRQQSQ